jgi:hypothetical protein
LNKVAAHEAGHAVAVAVYGGAIPLVSAATTVEEIDGILHVRRGAMTYSGLDPESACIALLAGGAAEVVFIDHLCASNGVPISAVPRLRRCIDAVQGDHAVDFEEYCRVGRCNAVQDAHATAALALVEGRWSEVVAVGRALMSSMTRTIEFDVVRRIVAGACA